MTVKSQGRWCLIESDPGVFTALVDRLGVKGVAFKEVYGLDQESFNALDGPGSYCKVLGFIFLFNWEKDKHKQNRDSGRPFFDPTADEAPFFAAQKVENACASQAIISILMNCKEEVPEMGTALTGLYEFTKDLRDPAMRGEAIGNCHAVREAHNAFRSEASFDISQDEACSSKDAFHFVSYIPKGKSVFELDGLKQGPICIGVAGEDWKHVVMEEIRGRVQEMQGDCEELRFSLMAVTTNPLERIEEEISKANAVADAASTKLQGQSSEGGAELPADPEKLEQLRRMTVERIAHLEETRQVELEKRAGWCRENARRLHDFTPFILCALRHLARRGELVALVKGASNESAQKYQAANNAEATAG